MSSALNSAGIGKGAPAMGQVVSGVIWAVLVAVTLRPPFRRGRLGFACFVLSMSVNEIPLVFLLVVGISVALPAVGGPPDDAAWLSVPLFAFVVVGLVWLQVRAGRAAAVLGQSSTPWLPGMLLPFQRHARDVVRLRNQSYGPHGRANLVDVYHDRTDAVGRPILVHLHGGGFVQGGKSREGVGLLNQLASHGWLCLSANYRLSGDSAHPNPLVDAKRIIAWARAHATELGADPGVVALVGSSAGAHLATSAALTANDPRLQPGFEDADTTVVAFVSLYGYLGPRTADPYSTPAALVHDDAPPALVIESGNDTSLPVGLATAFVTALRSVSTSPVVHAVLPGAQHGFDFFTSVRARVTANAVENFLDGVRADAPRG